MSQQISSNHTPNHILLNLCKCFLRHYIPQGARRIIHEWPDLDAEARRVTARIFGEEIEAPESITPSPVQPDGSTNTDDEDDTESRSEL